MTNFSSGSLKKGYKIMIFLAILLVFIFFSEYKNIDNIEYQRRMLNDGTTEEKIEAIEFLANKQELSLVPILIENIDNNDFSTYKNSPKMPETLSCVSTFSLQKITKKLYGNTCNADGSKNEEIINKTIQAWRDWYKNEYPQWLAEQKKHVPQK